MTLEEVLRDVWSALLVTELPEVTVEGASYRVRRTRRQGLRFVEFPYGGHRIEAIEQNPATRSQWATRAQAGDRIVQFRVGGRYVANVCEGRLTRYAGWGGLGPPDSAPPA